MDLNWQDVVALALVLAAAAFVIVRLRRRSGARCNGCHACPQEDQPEFLQIDRPQR